VYFKLHTRIGKIIRQAGFSLLELTIVVLILGIMAAVVIPDYSSTNPSKLDLAAKEVAEAIRFARSESMRLGEPRGFYQVSVQQRIQVYRANTATAPWSRIYDVYHPISKKLYDIQFKTHPVAKIDDMVRNRTFRGTCNDARSVYFDSAGIAYCLDPETVLCEEFRLTLTLAGQTRIVTLNGISGRVSIQ